MVAANRSRTASHGDAEKLDADQRIETQGERNPAVIVLHKRNAIVTHADVGISHRHPLFKSAHSCLTHRPCSLAFR